MKSSARAKLTGDIWVRGEDRKLTEAELVDLEADVEAFIRDELGFHTNGIRCDYDPLEGED